MVGFIFEKPKVNGSIEPVLKAPSKIEN